MHACNLLQAIKAAEEHLAAVAKERSLYKSVCKDSKSNHAALFTANGTFQPPPPGSAVPSLCHDTVVYYSFDMAQQVSYCHCLLTFIIYTVNRYTIHITHCNQAPCIS